MYFRFRILIQIDTVHKQSCCPWVPGVPGVPGLPWHTQILADQLTLFQPGGTDHAHLITTGTPGFSDLPTALYSYVLLKNCY